MLIPKMGLKFNLDGHLGGYETFYYPFIAKILKIIQNFFFVVIQMSYVY